MSAVDTLNNIVKEAGVPLDSLLGYMDTKMRNIVMGIGQASVVAMFTLYIIFIQFLFTLYTEIAHDKILTGKKSQYQFSTWNLFGRC